MKDTLVIIGVVAALVLGGLGIVKQGTTVINQVPKSGALAGPDIPSSYLHWGAGNGLFMPLEGDNFTAATTTPCDITSPASTSTLIRLTIQTASATGSSYTIRVASSTVPNATTTSFNYIAIASGFASYVYIPTASTTVFSPSQHLVVGIEGFSYGPTISGVCTANWTVL